MPHAFASIWNRSCAHIVPPAQPHAARRLDAWRIRSSLHADISAANTAESLLGVIKTAAAARQLDPPSLVTASQRLQLQLSASAAHGSTAHAGITPQQHAAGHSSPAGVSATADALSDAVIEQLPNFSVEQLVQILQSLVALPPLPESDPARRRRLLEAAAQLTAQLLHASNVPHNLALLVAFADLGAHASDGGSVSVVISQLVQQLGSHLVDGPVLQASVLADGELPACGWAAARLHTSPEMVERWSDRCLSPERGLQGVRPSSNNVAGVLRPNVEPDVATFMDRVAGRARSHLMNRHSAKATFSPQELSQLVASYALLGYNSLDVAAMLEAAAGFAARRIRARHLNAVSRLDHTAQLLWSIAVLEHSTVASRELLSASSDEIAHQLATSTAFCDPASSSSSSRSNGSTSSPDQHSSAHQQTSAAAAQQQQQQQPPPPAWQHHRGATSQLLQQQHSNIGDLVAILSAHWHLGYRPSEKLLVAVGPYVCRHGSALTPVEAASLDHMMRDFSHTPRGLLAEVIQQQQAAAFA